MTACNKFVSNPWKKDVCRDCKQKKTDHDPACIPREEEAAAPSPIPVVEKKVSANSTSKWKQAHDHVVPATDDHGSPDGTRITRAQTTGMTSFAGMMASSEFSHCAEFVAHPLLPNICKSCGGAKNEHDGFKSVEAPKNKRSMSKEVVPMVVSVRLPL